MDGKLKILHLEDNLMDSVLVKNLLSRLGLSESYTLVDNRKDFIEAFTGILPDLFISDMNLPDFSGFDALEWIVQKHPLIPVVIVTGSIDEETAAKTIQLGAWDYVVKERLHRLPTAIENVLKLKSERKELVQAKKMAENILQTTPSAVFTVDNEGFFTTWNKMAETITGYNASTMIGQSSRILGYRSSGDSGELIDLEGKPSVQMNVEGDILSSKGVRINILRNTDILRNDDGEIIGGIESFIDQSEKIQMTRDLVRAKERAEESDRLKSAFLENISHEIRTPLNAIIGFSDLVIDPNVSLEDKTDFSRIITTGCDQLLSILGNVLQFSLIESGTLSLKVDEFELSDLVHELLLMRKGQAIEKGLILELESAKNLKINSDRSNIGLILTSLLDNAEKFTAEGKINFGYRQNGHKVLFYVSDTGKGIPEHIGDRVFERFYRVNDAAHITAGSGLGLPISKAIVKALGGTIWHEPNGTKGTTFFFEIPRHAGLG